MEIKPINDGESMQPKTELDTPWKKILDDYFKDFVEYCLPEQHQEIDWSRGYKTLDKELSKISRDAPVSNRVVDKLIEVFRKNGEEAYVLVHLEVQGQKTHDFEERMFTYRYRLRDLHRKPIASLAILVDPQENWRPSAYREELWGSSIEMRFPSIKLLDYRTRIQELEEATNPFATVILAQLKALEESSSEDKLLKKIDLIRWLYKKGWKKIDVLNLLIFIEWVMALPEEFELKYRQAVQEIEEELHVSYVSSFERAGMEKGMQQGEGAMLLCFLEGKFKTVPENYRQKVSEADPDTLLLWGKRVMTSQTLEEVFGE